MEAAVLKSFDVSELAPEVLTQKLHIPFVHEDNLLEFYQINPATLVRGDNFILRHESDTDDGAPVQRMGFSVLMELFLVFGVPENKGAALVAHDEVVA